METGSDGRFYDSHYDFNHNGFLDCGEQLLYEKDVFGENTYSGGYSSRRSSSMMSLGGLFLWLFSIFLIIAGLIMMLAFPPVGALLIIWSYHIKEQYL